MTSPNLFLNDLAGSFLRLLFRLVFLALLGYASSPPSLAENDLLWFKDGRPTREAHQAIEFLNQAHTEGLEPTDYDAEGMADAIDQAKEKGAGPDSGIRDKDRALTLAMQRYLSDLRTGRVTPGKVRAEYTPPATKFDAESHLRQALQSGRFSEAVRGAAPSLPFYAELRQALASYRILQDHPAWQTALPPLPGKKLESGQAYAGTHLLAQRLEALGDLPARITVSETYDPALVAAIRSFQERHGLETDGVIGQKTFEQLQITPAQRMRQIALTMERLRWTPLRQGPRMILVNIPEFSLRAYEFEGDKMEILFFTKVIVGRAARTRTPVFDEAMRFIEFSPYWNIPRSIARGETIPKLRREPGYFREQGFEFVTSGGNVLRDLTSENLDDVLRGTQRIRQRPGPENALGKIKFVFPNHENIYLHDTPAKQLFDQVRRDFSHGCIRVQYPLELAKFVLKHESQWDEASIVEAMDKGTSRTIRLREPLPVVIAYQTAMVRNDKRIYFFPDIYGYDRILDEALRQRGR